MVAISMPVTPSTLASTNSPTSPPMSVWSPEISSPGSFSRAHSRNESSISANDDDFMFGPPRRVLSFYEWDDDEEEDEDADDNEGDGRDDIVNQDSAPRVFSFDEWSEGRSRDDQHTCYQTNRYMPQRKNDDERDDFYHLPPELAMNPSFSSLQSSISFSKAIVPHTFTGVTAATTATTMSTDANTISKRGLSLAPIETDFSDQNLDHSNFWESDGNIPRVASSSESISVGFTLPSCTSSESSPTLNQYAHTVPNGQDLLNNNNEQSENENDDGHSCSPSPCSQPPKDANVHDAPKSIPSVIFIPTSTMTAASSMRTLDEEDDDDFSENTIQRKRRKLQKRMIRFVVLSLSLLNGNEKFARPDERAQPISGISTPISTTASF